MAFQILNQADAANADQAEPDSVDIDILVAAFAASGVVSGCAVTAQGTPDLTVAVASGTALVAGASVAVTGANATIGAANGSNPRFDLITINNSGTIATTAGTAAANPVFPAIPANSIVLAAVYVPALDTAINSNQITDKRILIALITGAVNEVVYNTATDVQGSDPDFTFDGLDAILRGKMDIGAPGTGSGLDIGEGGSYSADKGGTTIVQAFSYDASAASGSRFTELTITSNNTLLGDAGDRLYVGSTSKYWAMRCTIGVLKTSETYLGFYYNGSALAAATIMGIKKDAVTSVGTAIFEQTAEQEYVTFDQAIDNDWAAADNVLDVIPDTASSLFWFVLQVPVGGFTTPPRIDDIKVRGTDADFATGTSQLILWGKARIDIHFDVGNFSERKAAQPRVEDIVMSTNVIAPLYDLNNSTTEGVDFSWQLPPGIDTSSKVTVSLDSYITSTGEFKVDLFWKFVTQGTVVITGPPSDTGTQQTAITPSAADAVQTQDVIGPAGGIDISSLAVNDRIFFTLDRTASDTNTGGLHPIAITLNFVRWTAGEHV